MKVKIAELQGSALDWAVAKCEFGDLISNHSDPKAWMDARRYSTDGARGSLIIEREGISTQRTTMTGGHAWEAEFEPREGERFGHYGPTHLIAAMRCYVASENPGLDEIDIPDELCEQSQADAAAPAPGM